MLLTQYAKREGRGVIQRLQEASTYVNRDGDLQHVSYKTIVNGCTHGLAITNYECAEAISRATGGACSIDEIRKPHLFAPKGRRRKAA
jgi:hypothetical protein